MNIDREQLIDLLVERTPRGREEVERQFNEMIAEITDLTAEGKPYTIDGFGTFSLQEGLLTFEAAEELQTEINYKYVGMKPVEIVKPNRDMPEADAKSPVQEQPETESPEPEPESDTEPEPEISDEDRLADIWGIPSASELDERARQREDSEAEKKPQSGDEEEPAAADRQEAEDEPVGEETDIDEQEAAENDEAAEESEEAGKTEAGENTGDREDDAEELPVEEEPEIESDDESEKELQELLESEEPPAEEEPAEADAEPEKKQDQKIEQAASSPKAQKTTGRGRPGKRKVRKRSDYTIAVLFAIFSVIVATGVVYWAAMNPTHSEETTGSSTTQAAAGTGSTVSEDVASGSDTDVPPATGDDAVAGNKEAAPPKSSPDQRGEAGAEQADDMTQNQLETASAETKEDSGDIYGLHGEVNSSANDGYTIVVYSLKNGANARNIKGQIEADNYRALLKKVPNGNGDTYWRVSIGQFETISDAQQAAKKLEQPYRDHHFIHRI